MQTAKAFRIIAPLVTILSMATPAMAQVPPELFGGGSRTGPIHSEAFYKGPEGFWVLMRNPQNDGYRCAVNFITGDAILALHGPWDAQMAGKDAGMVWFDGKDIPKAKGVEQAQITVLSKDPTRTMPVLHTNMQTSNGTFVVAVNIKQMLKEKLDSDEITVQFQGKDVYHIKPIRLQEAYKQLDTCMSARRE